MPDEKLLWRTNKPDGGDQLWMVNSENRAGLDDVTVGAKAASICERPL